MLVMDYNLYPIAVGSMLLSIPDLLLRGLIQRLMEGVLFGSLLLTI